MAYLGFRPVFDVADNTIVTADLQDGSVTNPKLATDAVSEIKIQDDAVTNTKILNNAITSDKILDDAITNGKIRDGEVINSHLIDNVINNRVMANNAIDTAEINDLAVENSKIADGAIDYDKLAAALLASDAEVFAETVQKVVTADTLKSHPGIAKAYVNFDINGTSITINESYNVASVTRISSGIVEITFTNAFANTEYVHVSGSFADLLNELPRFMTYYPSLTKTASVIQMEVSIAGSAGPDDTMDDCVVAFFGELA